MHLPPTPPARQAPNLVCASELRVSVVLVNPRRPFLKIVSLVLTGNGCPVGSCSRPHPTPEPMCQVRWVCRALTLLTFRRKCRHLFEDSKCAVSLCNRLNNRTMFQNDEFPSEDCWGIESRNASSGRARSDGLMHGLPFAASSRPSELLLCGYSRRRSGPVWLSFCH